ncbi:MAG TPA: hypothetical protein VF850_10925 [Gemmatimonadaceae bacterium]
MSGQSDVRRTLETVIAAAVSAAMALAYLVIVGRTLGPAEYADFSAALSVIYFFAIALTPVTPTLARVIAAMSVRGDIAGAARLRSSTLRNAAVALAAVAIAGAAVATPIARLLHFGTATTPLLAIVTASIFALLSVDRGALQGLLLFRQYNLSIVIETGLRLVGALILVKAVRMSAPSALVSYAAGVVVAEVAIAIVLSHTLPVASAARVDWQPLKTLAVPMFALMIAVAIFQNADMLAVKRWFAATPSGLYGAATALAKSFGVLFVPLYVLTGPILTRLYEARQPILRPALVFCGWFLLLSAVPLAIVILWPDVLVRVLYGPQFTASAPLIAPLGGVAIVTYCALLLVQVLITAEAFAFLRIYAAGAVVMLGGLFLFHDSFAHVIIVLYVSQLIVLGGVISALFRFNASRPAV